MNGHGGATAARPPPTARAAAFSDGRSSTSPRRAASSSAPTSPRSRSSATSSASSSKATLAAAGLGAAHAAAAAAAAASPRPPPPRRGRRRASPLGAEGGAPAPGAAAGGGRRRRRAVGGGAARLGGGLLDLGHRRRLQGLHVAAAGGPGLARTFSRATQVALSAMAAFGNAPDVRTKGLMLLHRMVETLGEGLLGYLDGALPQLLARADVKELVELVTLVNQLVLKFKDKIATPVAALFSPLAAATLPTSRSSRRLTSSSSAAVGAHGPASEPVRERRGLLRCFCSLLHSLVHSDLVGVLAAPNNSAHRAVARRAPRGVRPGPA